MAKRKSRKSEKDSAYLLKIILYFILGSIWLHLSRDVFPIHNLPVGLVVGLLFAQHEHFQIDRKIEYLVLLAAALLSYIAPIGVVLKV